MPALYVFLTLNEYLFDTLPRPFNARHRASLYVPHTQENGKITKAWIVKRLKEITVKRQDLVRWKEKSCEEEEHNTHSSSRWFKSLATRQALHESTLGLSGPRKRCNFSSECIKGAARAPALRFSLAFPLIFLYKSTTQSEPKETDWKNTRNRFVCFKPF